MEEMTCHWGSTAWGQFTGAAVISLLALVFQIPAWRTGNLLVQLVPPVGLVLSLLIFFQVC